MTKRFILQLDNNQYKGYYTGQVSLSPSGKNYPNIVANMDSVDVALYTSLKQALSQIQQLLFIGPSKQTFNVYEKFEGKLVYKVNYNNGKVESEQKF